MKEYNRQYNRERPEYSKRLYKTARWQKLRKRVLSEHPLCAECERQGRIAPATVTDHIIPHKGNLELFWDEGNLQSLCKSCHDRKTAKEGRWGEKVGFTGIKIDRCGSLFESRLTSKCPFQFYRLAANQG